MIYQKNWRFGLSGIMAAIALIVLANPAEASSRAEIKQMVVEEAQNSTVPPALALAVAKVESDFNPSALSTAGARGVMQIMPKTAKQVFGVDKDELWQARLNIQLGIDFLAKLRRQYGGKWDLALSHYNGGTLKGKGANAEPHEYTRNYVRMVQRWQQRYADQNEVWAVAFKGKGEERLARNNTRNNARNDNWEETWTSRTQPRKWRKFADAAKRDRYYAFDDGSDDCRKSSQKVAWREYDQFSAPFTRGFNRRYAQLEGRSDTRIRYNRSHRDWRRDRSYRQARSYRRSRPYRRSRNNSYRAGRGYSDLEERRWQAARSLDDFS